MGDIDGSSSAARSALPKSGNSKLKSFNIIARIKGLFLFGSKGEPFDKAKKPLTSKGPETNTGITCM